MTGVQTCALPILRRCCTDAAGEAGGDFSFTPRLAYPALSVPDDSPLLCSVEVPDGGGSDISVADPYNLWVKAEEQGSVTDVPTTTGEISVIKLTGRPPTVKIKCSLSREYRFERVSLDSWILYLPRIEVHGLDGGPRPTISYWVFKKGDEFLQQASQPPLLRNGLI